MDLDMKVIRSDPRDSIANVLAARRFDDEDHILVCSMANHAEETGKLGLKKAPVESELPALKSSGGRQRGGGHRGRF